MEDFYNLVAESKSVVITAHMSPDGDSISSVLSVYTILTTKYSDKDIKIIYTGTGKQEFSFLKNYDRIEWVDDIGNHVADADLLIVLDVNNLNRVSKNPEKLSAIKNTICIDHHASVPDSFTLSFIDPNISSNSEMVYRTLGAEQYLTEDLAQIFLLGIITDTGNFSHIKPSQVGAFDVAKKLVEIGKINIGSFNTKFAGIPKKVLPLVQVLVRNINFKEVEGWPDIQTSFIDRETFEQGAYTDEDMSTASHIHMGQYVTRIGGYSWGLVFTPRSDGTTRVSGRSLPESVNIRDMFERIQIGGGHDRASGGSIKESKTEDAIAQILDWMHSNKPNIN